ncbi:hypothetical protein GCM10007162_12800 [Ignatzschineria ureiclastica]|nr:hypothetical protein GCM10007162_12800 [Ignatzschineria ureiclastica]
MIGSDTRVRVVKNKVAPPFREAKFEIMYGSGIDTLGEVIDLGVEAGIVDKAGAWYSYNDTRLGQGKENAKQYFRENEALAKEVEQKVREHYITTPAPLVGEIDDEEDDLLSMDE